MWWSQNIIKHLPKSTGPYVPGCLDVMLGYSKNSLFMRLYYPTNAKKDEKENSKKWISWIPDEGYLTGISKVLAIPTQILRLVFWWTSAYNNRNTKDQVQIPVLYGEEPYTSGELKCIVMSHGMGGSRFLYSSICYDLASHGFLVVATEHRDATACYTYYYASEEDAKRDLRTNVDFQHIPTGENHYKERNQQIKLRSEECSKVVDFLTRLNSGNIPRNIMDDVPTNKESACKLDHFVGKMNLDDLVIMGHSFGGASALDTISKRKEFKYCILLDPWMFPIKDEKLVEKIQQSILFINTETFHIESNVKAMSKYLTNEKRKMYTILHTTHENQTDSVLIFGNWLNWFMKKLNPLIALKINNALILNFLHEHIKFPNDVTEQVKYLEEQHKNVQVGLTKPWA